MLHMPRSLVNLPFEIHTMEWIEDNRWQQNQKPHRHDYFVIIWVISGSGEHLVDLERHPIEDDSLYIIRPGQVHLMKVNRPVNGFVISFTPAFLGVEDSAVIHLLHDETFDQAAGSSRIHLDAATRGEVGEIVAKLEKEFVNFFLLRSEILRGYLRILLVYLTRHRIQTPAAASRTPQPRNLELTRAFLSLLEKDYRSKHFVADYATSLVVTPNHLNEVVKKTTGQPASYHIQQRIVLEAKRQAAWSGVSMKEIAGLLGFDDVAHFSKFFKKVAGMGFKDFRKHTDTALTP